jgi:hypothetical protein
MSEDKLFFPVLDESYQDFVKFVDELKVSITRK